MIFSSFLENLNNFLLLYIVTLDMYHKIIVKSKHMVWRMFAPLVAITMLAGFAMAPASGQAFHRAQPLIIPIESLFDNLDCG
jgi:hypothetical protein